MVTLLYILFFTFVGSILSLIGGIILLSREKFAIKISHLLSSFAAGALLGTAFFDLLPEAFEHAEEEGIDVNIFAWTLGGILIFFLLERFIHWFHHHHELAVAKDRSVVSLIVLGDGVHNFIDGVAIAASFMVSIPLGIVTSLAVAAHEIPQEIGDFGVLLHKGLSKFKVLYLNVLSALTAIFGAVITFGVGEQIHAFLPALLAITAGFFIYIAASDLIPEIHNEEKRKVALIETLLLLLGVATIYLTVSILQSLALPH